MKTERLKTGSIVDVTQTVTKNDQTQIRHYRNGVVIAIRTAGVFIDFGCLQSRAPIGDKPKGEKSNGHQRKGHSQKDYDNVVTWQEKQHQ